MKAVVAIAGLAVAVGGMAGCGSSANNSSEANRAHLYTGGTSGGTPKRGGTLTFARAEDVQTMEPLTPTGNVDLNTDFQIYDQLAEYMPGHQAPVPALATSWSTSKDGLTYKFSLRHGVRFSNGEPLTSNDVVFSLRRFGSSANAGDPSTVSESIKRVSATGPYGVEIELSKPAPTLIEYLATAEASVVSKTAFEREGAKGYARAPIGSGAFKVKSFVSGKALELVRNQYYWRAGQPYLDGVTFTPVASATSRILGVRSGHADVADKIPYSEINSLAHVSGVRMLVEPLASSATVWFNHAVAPFSDPAVDRALSYATPRAAIIRSVFRGYAEPSTSVWAKGKYWDSSVKQLPYDPAKAKELLSHSSAPHGFSLHFLTVGGDQDSQSVATILQSAWGQIGVKVDIQQMEAGALFSKLSSGAYEVILPGLTTLTSDIPAPDELSQFSNFNILHAGDSWYKNQEAIALDEHALNSQSEAARQEDFSRLQKLLVEDPSLLELAYPVSATLARTNVRNFHTLPSSSFRLEQVWLGPPA